MKDTSAKRATKSLRASFAHAFGAPTQAYARDELLLLLLLLLLYRKALFSARRAAWVRFNPTLASIRRVSGLRPFGLRFADGL